MENKLKYKTLKPNDFKRLKEGDEIKVFTENGWLKFTYPYIKDSNFFRRKNQFGLENTIKRLIAMKSLKRKVD